MNWARVLKSWWPYLSISHTARKNPLCEKGHIWGNNGKKSSEPQGTKDEHQHIPLSGLQPRFHRPPLRNSPARSCVLGDQLRATAWGAEGLSGGSCFRGNAPFLWTFPYWQQSCLAPTSACPHLKDVFKNKKYINMYITYKNIKDIVCVLQLVKAPNKNPQLWGASWPLSRKAAVKGGECSVLRHTLWRHAASVGMPALALITRVTSRCLNFLVGKTGIRIIPTARGC